MAIPQYQTIKNHLVAQIDKGELVPGDMVASENQLAERFSVSRMTARRALEDLAETGLLYRTQGLGTFVADSRPMSSMLSIRNIADEITERGHKCDVNVVSINAVTANDEQAKLLGVTLNGEVFHSVLVFSENARPIQLEERFVNPDLIPNYLQQDFSLITPHEYLSKVAPLTEADHTVEAIQAHDESELLAAKYLLIPNAEPCLKVTRRTYSNRGIVSFAKLIYPGTRYRLGGHIQVT